YKTILNLLSIIEKRQINLVLGVGGGRIIDAGKLSASLSSTNFISIPTNPSNDGIASPAVSYLLRQEMTKLKKKYYIHAPIAIIADTEIISNAPSIAIASGCGDMLAKFVAIRDWQLAYRLKGEDYSEYAASMALMSAELVLKKISIIRQGYEEGIRILVKALIGSGVSMSIAGSSRPASGSEHLFSHALDLLSRKYGFKPAYHGLQTGVGAIMMMWLHGGDWEKIRDALKKVNAATNAYELGIDPKYIIEALTLAHKIRPERYTILGDRGLTRSAAERVAKETGVI
ncbi:MAG TPA: iron-containing alcohol dehydrogenase, partial [Thermoprotei archaeon]|nr:iron-containing alcohol dehydrogenase [Thermoprotei archaeon]